MMTNTELKKKVASALDIEWYKNLEETINMPYLNISVTLKGITAIYEYVNQQCSGWEKIGTKIPKELAASKSYFINIRDQIESFVNSHTNQQSVNLNHLWTNIRNQIIQINNILPRPLTYDAPQTDYLIRVFNEAPAYFPGTYNTLIPSNEFRLNNRESLYGALLAYEFTLKDNTELTERRNAEMKSISRIRDDFKRYLSESEGQLLDHLSSANQKYKTYIKSIDELKVEKENLFNTWFSHTKEEDWNKWYISAKTKIIELESAYKEKLKLEAPAKYWSERGKELKVQGWRALIILVLLVGVTSISLGKILWSTPDQIYISWFGDDKSAAIRWSIIYITLISFIAYCVRAITKVMFSSFHLSRDCEERHTLTYFYLALLKDSKVDEKDRQLIIQSLFSRAETGLLKDDSSPTMPSDSITRMSQGK